MSVCHLEPGLEPLASLWTKRPRLRLPALLWSPMCRAWPCQSSAVSLAAQAVVV